MVAKYGIIEALKKDLYQWPGVFDGQWQQLERYGKTYLRIHSFEQYFIKDVPFQLDAVFDSVEAYDNWYNSDIGYIDKNWRGEYSDYKQAREKIKSLVQDKGFPALSALEKRVAASWFVLTIDEIDQVLTLEEKMKAAALFNVESIASRSNRFGAVMIFVRNVLEYPDAMKINEVVMRENFVQLYTQMGQEGTMTVNYDGVADQPGLFDFILSTPGTRFETTGVGSFNIVPKYGFTMEQVVAKCMDFLMNGNY